MRDARLVIYPTARKVQDQLVRQSRDRSLLGYRITTMPQVIEALWGETLDRRGSIDAIAERLMMREAVARFRAEEPQIEISPGAADRMLSLIRQLKSAKLTPEDSIAASAGIRRRDIALETFAKIFGAYQTRLEECALADGHDQEAAVFEFLLRCERIGTRPHYLEGVERILVAEIYDLSLLQFMIIAALIRIVGDAELTIQAAPHKVDASRFADLTWNCFVSEESIADKVLPEFVRREGRSGRLGFLLEHIFIENPPSAPPPDETVAIIEAPDPRAEADEAARTIYRLCETSDEPIDLSRIAIVARNIALYREHLGAAFRRYGLPLSINSGEPLRGTAPARALIAIVNLPVQNYRRDALLALSDNSLIDNAVTDAHGLLQEVGYVDQTRPLAECFERRRGELIEAMTMAGDEETQRRIEANLTRLERHSSAWKKLLDQFRPFETNASLGEHLKNLRALLEWLKFDPARALLTDSAARATGALWSTLDSLAVEAQRLAPDRELSPQEFLGYLEEVLRDAELEASVPTGPAVQVLSVMDARGLDFDRVFLLGMNEGVFPQQHPDNPLIPDEVVRELNPRLRERLRRKLGSDAPDAPGPIIRSRAHRNAEEPFLFFLALSMPSHKLVLSYAAEDEQGKPLGPSPYLAEVRRLLDSNSLGQRARRSGALPRSMDDCVTERDLLNFAAMRERGFDASSDDALARRAASVAQRIAVEKRRANYLLHPKRQDRLSIWQKQNKDWATPEAIAPDPGRRAIAGSYTGRVTSSDALKALLTMDEKGMVRRWSATQFSELAQCGFKFFARRILQLREDEDADEEQSRLEVGSMVHRVLFAIAEAKLDYGNVDNALYRARSITSKVESIERGRARDTAFFDAEWETVERMIEEVIRYECDRYDANNRPDDVKAECRLDFQLQGNDAPEIRIEGAIDRLEIWREGANSKLLVIDYKTSGNLTRLEAQLKENSFATTELQLPIYLLGATKQFVDDGSEVKAAAAFVALKSRDKSTDTLDVPADRIDPGRTTHQPNEPIAVAARLFDLLNEAQAGCFDVDPLECSDYCPYRLLCRIGTAPGV